MSVPEAAEQATEERTAYHASWDAFANAAAKECKAEAAAEKAAADKCVPRARRLRSGYERSSTCNGAPDALRVLFRQGAWPRPPAEQ